MPFEEIHHTADRAIRVWAKDLPTFFSEAALGLLAISGIVLDETPIVKKKIEIHSPDPESLLVAFLSELIYCAEQENLAFNEIIVDIEGDHLLASMAGAPIKEIIKYIKAVTFHNLKITNSISGVEAEIVFDV
jgi:SHS2 domain-containing protein